MKTTHRIVFESSTNMEGIPSNSVGLMVTSPPYPMIEMWDEIFSKQNPDIQEALNEKKGTKAFELMHQLLDLTWNEVFRVLIDGGIACINVGDATRTVGDNFQLYNNHSRIINHCLSLGLQTLPSIIWRKQTNAPNKFMGSGMLPPGAYVTLEHEYILVLRKGAKRAFMNSEKQVRQNSAYFWEERNVWFSDIWLDIKGTNQNLKKNSSRNRSGAYPYEIPYRLINMFSVEGDTILDPFLGTGTSTLAAIASARNSVGYEIDSHFEPLIKETLNDPVDLANDYIDQRIRNHIHFVKHRLENGKELKKHNAVYDLPCISAQEERLFIREVESVTWLNEMLCESLYYDEPQHTYSVVTPLQFTEVRTHNKKLKKKNSKIISN